MPQSNEYMLKQDDAELIYQKKLTAGTNITIDPVTNTISSTGGGGSSVSYSGSLPQGYGDTIGIITIDGTQYPIKIRNLIQGSNINIVQDMTTGNLTISSTAQGTHVEPNPSGTPTNTLDTIGINGTIYEIEGGGSGNVADVYVNGVSVLDENDIAQVFSHQEITEQEYEALPSTKESDNIMYCIKGSRPSTNGNYFTPIIYSTEEREIGVWTNGKPLYAKTFIQQLSGNAGQVDISACGADMMFAHSGYYDIGVTMLGLNERLNNQYLTYTHVNVDTMQYIDCTNTIAADSTIVVCCLYTKTTDVAGGGSYTTLGVPAVHYSADEQVIGTWIDGKPLYQKTYNINETIHNQDKTIDVSSLNIKKYINGYGTFMRNVNWASPIIYIETPFNLYESNNNHSYLRYGKSSNTIDYGVTLGDNETATDITITIQYTKTS